MLTFQMMYTEVYQGAGLTPSDSVSINYIKRNINNAVKLMKSSAMQYYTRKEVAANLVANQQYYTFNPDMIRIRNVRVNNGSLIFPIRSVESENDWNALNVIPSFAVFYPQRWFQRGPQEIGVWPLPSIDIANALLVAYDSRLEDMYLDDTLNMPLTVTNGSSVVTTTGANNNFFNANMVGMKLSFTDGSDGQWYNIVGYTSPTQIIIGNLYPNASQTSSSTIIGSCPDIPEEFQTGLEDYAFYRYYKTQRGSAAQANDFYQDFLLAQENYGGTFSDKDSSQVLTPMGNAIAFNPLLVPPINMQG